MRAFSTRSSPAGTAFSGPPPRPRHLDATLIARTRPISSSQARLLPVMSPLRALLPEGGLRRGTVLTVGTEEVATGDLLEHMVGGVTTLAFSLLVQASSTGSWCAAVGTADPGIVALAELGIDLERVIIVSRAAGDWAEVTATLLQGMDVVLLRPPDRVGPGAARRLVARARERRAVLVVIDDPVGKWPEAPDLRLAVGPGTWVGIEAGHGHLRGRRVEVVAAGRRGATRPMRTVLWLPGPSGVVAST
jgi:hypothetical protein